MPRGKRPPKGKEQRYAPYDVNLRRSSRVRFTPAEAKERDARIRRQEAEERDARLKDGKAYAEELKQARLNQAPVTSDDRSELDNIAYNVHYCYKWDGRGDQCVTAVIYKKSKTYEVFCQRFMTMM